MASIRKHRDKFQVRVRRSGLRPLTKTFSVRKDALEWARHMEVRADRCDLPTDPKQLQQITLADLVKRYRDEVSTGKKGREMETIVLNAFLRHPICTRKLSDLTTEDFAQYRDERLKTIKPTSLKRQLHPIHNLFEVARTEWGIPILTNPLTALKLKTDADRRERRLSQDEWHRLLEAATSARNPSVDPIIRLARETAMRRGELLSIHGKHLDLERRSLVIPITKNGHARTIPLTQNAVAVLQKHQKEGRLFPITPNAFRLAWERVRRRAKIADFHFHDLRHEAISRFFELGLTTPEVAQISGHRDARMLFRYAHAIRVQIIKSLTHLGLLIRLSGLLSLSCHRQRANKPTGITPTIPGEERKPGVNHRTLNDGKRKVPLLVLLE
jgi:integrase